MTTLALSIGSNIDAESNIRAAVNELRMEFENIRCSTIYESKAVGFDGDNFLNFVVLADTDKALTDVAAFLKHLEDRLGRDRQQVHARALALQRVLVQVGLSSARVGALLLNA